jgi:hypothetical protein
MMRLTFSGAIDDFSAVRTCIAHVIAGGPVALRQASFESLPDRDCFGGTHLLRLEGDGVQVEECIASNDEGNPRDGYGYSMSWTFTGTSARAGARASIRGSNYEPKMLGFTVEVSDAEGPAMQRALEALLGASARAW